MSLRILVCIAVTFAASLVGAACLAAEDSLPTPPQSDLPSNERSLNSTPSATTPQFKARTNMPPGMQSKVQYGGAVFEESYFRGLSQPMQSQIEVGRIPTATGGYNYGFPMQPFRYGYFGAERHQPRVVWHRKYYGEKVKSVYWNGY